MHRTANTIMGTFYLYTLSNSIYLTPFRQFRFTIYDIVRKMALHQHMRKGNYFSGFGHLPIIVIEMLPPHYEFRMNSRIITIEKQDHPVCQGGL
jgi:hypothetical protein